MKTASARLFKATERPNNMDGAPKESKKMNTNVPIIPAALDITKT